MLRPIFQALAIMSVVYVASAEPTAQAYSNRQNADREFGSSESQSTERIRSIRELSLRIAELKDKLSRTEQKESTLIGAELLALTEERVQALRDKLLELQNKEMRLQARLEELDYQLRPDVIQRTVVLIGGLRAYELRKHLRDRIENEKGRVNKQLELVADMKQHLETSIREAEADLEKLRAKRQQTDGGSDVY